MGESDVKIEKEYLSWFIVFKKQKTRNKKHKELKPFELGGSDHFGHTKILNDKNVNRKKYMGVLANYKINLNLKGLFSFFSI